MRKGEETEMEIMKTKTTLKGAAPRAAALVLMAAGFLAATAPREASADEPTVSAAGVVNINAASAEQLGLLPGIGASKARAIMEYRQRHPFARVDDLVGVRGIGRATLRRLRPYLAVRGDTTLTRPVASPRPNTAPPPTAQARAPVAAAHGAPAGRH